MKRYLLNLLLVFDQLLNALCLGDPDETLSSRAGKKHPRVARVINQFFWWDPRHCERVRENDEGPNGLRADDRIEVVLCGSCMLAGAVIWRLVTR